MKGTGVELLQCEAPFLCESMGSDSIDCAANRTKGVSIALFMRVDEMKVFQKNKSKLS